MNAQISVDEEQVSANVRAFVRTAEESARASLPEPTVPGLPETQRFDAALRAWAGTCEKLTSVGAERLGKAEVDVRATTRELLDLDAGNAHELNSLAARLSGGPRVR